MLWVWLLLLSGHAVDLGLAMSGSEFGLALSVASFVGLMLVWPCFGMVWA